MSHISLGSNAIAAKIVTITTPQNATAPGPGEMVARLPSATSAARIPVMNTSTIDQRPTPSTIR